jgi:asparagine synthase (glutamine-hydrolysing)
MCGIAGIVRRAPTGVSPEVLARMAAAMRHRGPDGFGLYAGARAGLAHARLSIIDLSGGAQPLGNEDGSLLVVFNGEIYNYIELRRELQAAGHRFRTSSDTEVLVHGYEQWGEALLGRLNGQFSFAILDRRSGALLLARDLFGIHPLYYCFRNGDFYFASEAKALFATGEVQAAPDAKGLDEVFTFWAARAPRTVFKDVQRLEPGCLAVLADGVLKIKRYHEPKYNPRPRALGDMLEELDALLTDSVRLRLRADVPVGGYLSGGLDSTIACTLSAAASPHQLRTFSVAFDDPALDERVHQNEVASRLGSLHIARVIGGADVAELFPDVIRHLETPVVRTAAAPLFALSRLTRDNGIKVVLTGEGSDELFLGYDLFKEVVVRRFCLRQPNSRMRPRLFDRLYPYLTGPVRGGEFWRRFFLTAGPADDPLFSHQPRARLTSRIKDFFAPHTADALRGFDACAELRSDLPREFASWSPLAKAAHIEIATLLEPYLLASQGDRVSLAHGVEARYPFLDPRLFEFATSLPDDVKLGGLDEKLILRKWARGRVPGTAAERPKQPYRAPDAPSFFAPNAPSYVSEMLQPSLLRDSGIFDEQKVCGLVKRCREGKVTSFAENQALVAVLSTQLWYQSFFRSPVRVEPLPLGDADVLMGDAATGAVSTAFAAAT